jgi:hypothetical protein
MLTQNVYAVGTAATTVVAPTLDAGRYVLKNLEPMPDDSRYARAGYVFLIDQFININSGGTANFLFETGAQGAQFEFWNFGSTSDNVRGYLIEGATIVSTGTAVPAYNMNRNEPDTYLSTVESATSITGGTVVVQELVNASKQAGGSMDSGKIVTLEPDPIRLQICEHGESDNNPSRSNRFHRELQRLQRNLAWRSRQLILPSWWRRSLYVSTTL